MNKTDARFMTNMEKLTLAQLEKNANALGITYIQESAVEKVHAVVDREFLWFLDLWKMLRKTKRRPWSLLDWPVECKGLPSVGELLISTFSRHWGSKALGKTRRPKKRKG